MNPYYPQRLTERLSNQDLLIYIQSNSANLLHPRSSIVTIEYAG